jgi:hypothetical protein
MRCWDDGRESSGDTRVIILQAHDILFRQVIPAGDFNKDQRFVLKFDIR